MVGGVCTSFLEIVTPAWVAKWKPTSLNASSTCEIVGAPYSCTRSSTSRVVSFFFIERLTNSYVLGSNSSPSASTSARSILSF